LKSAALTQLESTLQADMPNLIINSWIQHVISNDMHVLVVTITSFDPTNPRKLDPNNKVQECFISGIYQTPEECLEFMPASDIINWMNAPLPTGSWIGE
jgi:hypothetical protein